MQTLTRPPFGLQEGIAINHPSDCIATLKVQVDDFKSEGDRILSSFKEWVEAGADCAEGWALEPVNYEGYRISVDEGRGRKGWLLLRTSLHDPLLVLNVESDITGGKLADAQLGRVGRQARPVQGHSLLHASSVAADACTSEMLPPAGTHNAFESYLVCQSLPWVDRISCALINNSTAATLENIRLLAFLSHWKPIYM